MKMIEEYFNNDAIYKDKYGVKTFLLYHVGSFFEVYGLTNETSYANIERFSEICGLKLASKRICVGQDNVLMAGFRDYLLDSYIEKIHPHGYTIVVFVQEEVCGKITRKENGIYSPGTTFLDNVSILSNNLSCVWIQKTKTTTFSKEKFIFGLSNINIFNGKSNLCEYYETYYHNPTSYDTIEKFLNIYSPVETIIIHNLEGVIITSIVDFLQMQCKKYHIVDLNNREHTLSIQANNCEDQIYQSEIIKKYFPKMNYDVFKYTVSEKPICLQSYCFLLNFITQHNVCLIDKISEPIIENLGDILVCANHSLKQLNIIGEDVNHFDKHDKINGVLPILNKCITKMGKRAMNDIILNPLSNKNNLKKQYNEIEHFMKKEYNFDTELKIIKDIDKILTKFKLSRITPRDIYLLYETTMGIDNIYKLIQTDKKAITMFELSTFTKKHKQFVSFIKNCLNINSCCGVNTLLFNKTDDKTDDFIKQGYNIKLDELLKEQNIIKNKLKSINLFLETKFRKKNKIDFIQQHMTSNSELYLLITKKRSITLKDELNKMQKSKIVLNISDGTDTPNEFDFNITTIAFKDYDKSKMAIHSKDIDQLISTLYTNNIKYYEILTETFKKITNEIYQDHFVYLSELINSIKAIDVINTKCGLTKKYNLCKPKISDKEKSFVDAKKLRHLLIEIIEKNEIYVPNDISLGTNTDNLGILLFGTNSVGKTSLIKALGIAVIMAQSGFYVPCESFTFSPYKYIFTRIIGNDNIFKGLSTFGVEMSELRVILNNCDENSLILGDELCSGTEIDSALSIFNASLEIMTERKSNFIFATHFHELPHLKTMQSLEGVNYKHLKVQYDHEKQQMYYDRKIHDGQGDSIYGLEVCKSLKLPDIFLKRCYEIRNIYMENKDNVLLLKPSKYNKNKLRSMCEFCEKEIGTEIHHLQYQCDANDNEYIENSFHKNHAANLCSICTSCHDHIHSLNLRFEKRKTVSGKYEIILKKN